MLVAMQRETFHFFPDNPVESMNDRTGQRAEFQSRLEQNPAFVDGHSGRSIPRQLECSGRPPYTTADTFGLFSYSVIFVTRQLLSRAGVS